MGQKTNAFEGALASLGLRYWEYDITTKQLYRSALVQSEVGFSAYKENVPESYVEEGIIHPNYAQAYLDLYHNLAKGIDGRLTFQTMFANNTWGWLDISYKVIFDEKGNPTKAIGVGGDVTKEKQKELTHSLTQRDNELLHSVLQTSAAYEYDFLSYINKDTQNFITYSSFANEEVHTGEHFGQAIQERLQSEKVVNYKQVSELVRFDVICKALEQEERYSVSFVFERDEENYRYKLCRFYNVKGNRQYILMTVRDVTDIRITSERQKDELRKAKDAAEKANLAKTEFLSNISHDIRTPLNAIINLNDMVKAELDNPKQALSDLDKMGISGEFLLGLVNDILDISKVERKDTDLTNSLYPFKEFKQYIESVITPLCDQKNIKFHFDLAKGNEMIITDRTRFNQIFFNILSNAVKYNNNGGWVSMTSQVAWRKEGKIGINYIIEDNGIGMSEEFQKKLFQPFAREDTTGAYSGTGLGMNITKSIVQMMGGEIYVESTKNVGSKFTVYLILNIPSEDQMKEYNQVKSDEKLSREKSLDLVGHGKRVLIAEDHPLNQEILSRLVSKYGIITECVANGKLALESFVNHMPNYYDAILMDIRMPIMDGLEATSQIRACAKTDAGDIPIIAMTGNAFSEDIKKAKDVGMTEYLTKPIEPSKLTETLADVFMRESKKAAVLIVDDVEVNRETIGASLDEVNIYQAANGLEALEELSKHPEIEIVITDINMPHMDGLELIKNIRKNSQYDHISIIVNTQYGNPQQEEMVLNLGANDFVYKPSTPKIIQLRVKNALRTKQ